MGGGNGQKSKMAREKNMEKQKAAAKGKPFHHHHNHYPPPAGKMKENILEFHFVSQSKRFKIPLGVCQKSKIYTFNCEVSESWFIWHRSGFCLEWFYLISCFFGDLFDLCRKPTWNKQESYDNPGNFLLQFYLVSYLRAVPDVVYFIFRLVN